MQEITEQSIIDKFNKQNLCIDTSNLSKVISCLIENRYTKRDAILKKLKLSIGLKKLKLPIGINLALYTESRCCYIEIINTEGSVRVFKGYDFFDDRCDGRFFKDKWSCDVDVKNICLKSIDNLLDLFIAELEKKRRIWEEKCKKEKEKRKEKNRAVTERFVDKFKRKQKPSFFSFLFNWRK